MTFKQLKFKIKEEQKTLAQDIKNGKLGRKPKNRTDDNIDDYDDLFMNHWNYRHRHIIYCQMFNNTPYELIEQPSNKNRPFSNKLDRIKKEWEGLLDEALHNCA
jgi:hypothetical protein